MKFIHGSLCLTYLFLPTFKKNLMKMKAQRKIFFSKKIAVKFDIVTSSCLNSSDFRCPQEDTKNTFSNISTPERVCEGDEVFICGISLPFWECCF